MNTANTVNRLRTVMAAALFGAAASSLAALPAAAEAQPSVTVNRHVTNWQSFDVPEAGPGGTSPVAMNDLGVIVGNYSDCLLYTSSIVRRVNRRSRDHQFRSFRRSAKRLAGGAHVGNRSAGKAAGAARRPPPSSPCAC